MKRNSTIKLVAGVLAASLLAAGCSGAQKPADSTNTPAPAAKQEEKRLSFYTSFSTELYTALAESFEKETGIKVDIVHGGTGEMLNRIKAEAADPQGDVMLGGGAESYEAYRQYFDPYKVKDDNLIPATAKAADNLWYGFNSLPMVFIYNKNLVKENEKPAGWKDLTDPKWKGKIAMADATKSGTSFVQIVTVATIFGQGDNKGWDVVKGIVKNAKVLDSSSLPIKGTNDGEYAIGITHENGAWKYMQNGGPVGIIYPTEGTATIPDSAAVIKGAKHPENARKFMDFLFSKSTQELAAKNGLRPVRSDVAPPQGLIPADQLKMIKLDMNWVVGKRDDIMNTWKDILTSK